MNGEMPKVRVSFYTKYVKRALDILLSGTAIIIASPLMAVLSILELIFHGRPIVFEQERPGLHEKIFKIYKFRSMTNETDEDGELLPNAQRVTSFGRFIRRFSLDELPELFCIFTGKMSIIGPRPLLPEYLPYYSRRHSVRHEIRPGLECPPLKPVKLLTWNAQFENDVWYVENCSFLVDLKMLFIIMKEAVAGEECRTDATRDAFSTYNPAYGQKPGKADEVTAQ